MPGLTCHTICLHEQQTSMGFGPPTEGARERQKTVHALPLFGRKMREQAVGRAYLHAEKQGECEGAPGTVNGYTLNGSR